jgi:hypothetical protein
MIVNVEGIKGGTGKSIVSMASLDVLEQAGRSAFLVETDPSNPDVWKSYKDLVPSITLDLSESSGWIELINAIDANRDRTVVINGAARSDTGLAQFGSLLEQGAKEIGKQLTTLFVINRQRDSVELLKKYHQYLPTARVHALRNLYWGNSEKFETYNTSKTKADLEARGGRSINFPDLADRVADRLYVERLSISAAMTKLPLGDRVELGRFRAEVKAAIGGVLDE